MQACHHLTYERVGHERLEDLQAICDACHAYESGKTDHDPRSVPSWQRLLIVLFFGR
jgi:hypothetical protein